MLADILPVSLRLGVYSFVSGQSIYAVPFAYDETNTVRIRRLRVGEAGLDLTAGTHFTVAPETGLAGEISLTAAGQLLFITGDKVAIYGRTEASRPGQFSDTKKFRSDAVNWELNSLLLLIQELIRDLNRSVRLEFNETALPALTHDLWDGGVPMLVDGAWIKITADEASNGIALAGKVDKANWFAPTQNLIRDPFNMHLTWTLGTGITMVDDLVKGRTFKFNTVTGQQGISPYIALTGVDNIPLSFSYEMEVTSGAQCYADVSYYDASKVLLLTAPHVSTTAGTAYGPRIIDTTSAPVGTAFFRTRIVTGANSLGSARLLKLEQGTGSPVIDTKFRHTGGDVAALEDFLTSAPGAVAWTEALGRALVSSAKTIKLPGYRIPITDKITVPRDKTLAGESRLTSGFNIASGTFNAAATAVIEMTGPEPGGCVRDMSIVFVQPDTSTRASMNAYPPAFLATDVPRLRIERVQIENAMFGIKLMGNCGGATIADINFGCHSTDLYIDGSKTSMHLKDLDSGPFGMSALQRLVRGDDTFYAFEIGNLDDLQGLNWLILSRVKALRLFAGSGGNAPFGAITNIDFDNRGGLVMEAGEIRITSAKFTQGSGGPTGLYWLKQSGGRLHLVAPTMESNLATADAPQDLIQLSGTAQFKLTGGDMKFPTNADVCLLKNTSASVEVDINGLTIARANAFAYASAFLDLGSGKGKIAGVRMRAPPAAGSGQVLVFSSAPADVICYGNHANGWTPGRLYGQANWTTTFGSESGTITAVAAAAQQYRNLGGTIDIVMRATISTAGTGAGYLSFTLPVAAQNNAMLPAYNEQDKLALVCELTANSTLAKVRRYDGATPIVSGRTIRVAGQYQPLT